MTRGPRTLSVCSLLLLLGAGSGPTAQDDVTYHVPDGLEVTIWAESPHFYNPTNIDVDARGRIWVTEAVNYRGRQRGGDYLKHPKGDRVVILEDTNGDGACDTSKVFVQDKDLVAPLGIAVIGNQVIVSCSPSVIIYTDEDGDDTPDKKEIFLKGFGGRDNDHSVHAFCAGPDGRWYFNAGNAGPHVVEDKAGWTLRAGRGRKSDDGRRWIGGLALRVDPDGTGLTVLGHNFRNCYEITIDSFGNLWQNDNDDDGNRGCRTSFLMEGGNAGYRSEDGTRSWNVDRRPGQTTPDAHWHQEDPGVMPVGDITGAGAPAGIAMLENGSLGKGYAGLLLSCDTGQNAVFGYRPALDGAGYTMERFRFLTTLPKQQDSSNAGAGRDKRKWFRPSDVAIGTDGAVYVADWYDSVVGGNGMHDKKGYGRILRVTRKGHRPRAPKIDLSTTEGQIAALCNPAVNVRNLGWRKLKEQGKAALPALENVLKHENAHVRARALWLVEECGGDVVPMLKDADPNIRITAFRVLRKQGRDVLRHAASLAKDPSASVRREVALALRDVPVERCRTILLELASRYDGRDRWFLEAWGIGCDGKEASLYPEIARGKPIAWSDATADLVWRLHPVAAIPALVQRASSSELSPERRKQAVVALGFIRDRRAAEAMLGLIEHAPGDVRRQAEWWVRFRHTNDWRAYDLLSRLPVQEGMSKPVYTSGIVRKGSVDVAVDLTDVRTLRLVVTTGGGGMGHDWADWCEPRLEGPEGTVRLTDLEWISAAAGWGKVHKNKNCNGGPLQVGGKKVEYGIGTHAPSSIDFAIPPGKYTTFKARAALDDRVDGNRGQPDVEFRVFVEKIPDRTIALRFQKLLLDPKTGEKARREAAGKLASTPAGGVLLINLARKKQIPQGMMEEVAGLIFRNPDPGVRALASEYFERRTDAGEKLPPVRELLAMKGDAKKGRDVFNSKAAGCIRCHTIDGEGGNVGPDLTKIHEKYDRGALLDTILNPSSEIAFGYESWLLERRDGRTYYGFLLSDGETVTLHDTEGKDYVIPAKQIVSRRKSSISVMPDNVAMGLKPAELVDLVAYLAAARRPGSEWIQLFNRKDLQGWTYDLSDANKTMEDVWSVKDGILICKGRPSGYIKTEKSYSDYELVVEWRWVPGGSGGNNGVLVHSSTRRALGIWPKSLEVQLASGNAGDFWVIGEEIKVENMEKRREGRHIWNLTDGSEKPIGEWNRMKIRCRGSEIKVWVNGDLVNHGTDCSVTSGSISLQSEGTPIHFRKVALRKLK